MDPPLSSGPGTNNVQKRGFLSESSFIASSQNTSYQRPFFQSNNQKRSLSDIFSSNSFLGLLNSPLSIMESTHSGFENFSSFNRLVRTSSSSLFGKPSTRANVSSNDGYLVQNSHPFHNPSLRFHDYDGKIPLLLLDHPMNQLPASGWYITPTAENPSEFVGEGHNNTCNSNHSEDYHHKEHLKVAHGNNGNTTRKKKKKMAKVKGKGKIAREASPDIIKGHWSPDEDRLLLQQVERFGVGRWTKVAKYVKGREGKQCRERWFNYLRPDIKTEGWTEEEDQMIIDAYSKMGSKWSVIQNLLPGRTENSIKNHWNTVKRRVENKMAATGRQSSANNRKNTRLEKFIMSLISSNPTRMPNKSSRRVSKVEDSTQGEEDEDEDEESDDQRVEDYTSVVAADETCFKHDQAKEEPASDMFANYYKLGPPVARDDQHSAAAGGTSKQFEKLDSAWIQHLNDYDMSNLINNQEDDWKAEMEAIRIFLAKDM